MSALAAMGSLPQWDLSDLFAAPDAPALEETLSAAQGAAEDLQQRYKGTLASLDGDGLATAIKAYEALKERLDLVASYAQLVHAGDMTDPDISHFYQSMLERVTDIATRVLFFELELNQMEEQTLAPLLHASATLRGYAPWLRDVRAFREHQLSETEERLLHEKHVTGQSAWTRLFDETLASLRFEVNGKKLTNSEVLHLLSHPNRDTRRAAGQAIGTVLDDNIRLFTLITNTLAKDKEIEDKWRRFDSPIAARNLANFVEGEVVDALHKAVRESFPALAHRYYRLKGRWLGLAPMQYWDRNAPLPGDKDQTIAWDEASRLVLESYHRFSPELAAIGRRFFDNAWIDVPPRPGKAPGAFAHPVVPSAHPYLLLNYHGKLRDVMTLAHELGHGVHQVLAAEQGFLMADTPLTLAETASVFGEMLTFRALLEREQDPTQRKIMLASKVEDMLNTVVRQIAMSFFEHQVHNQRRQGELTADQIGQIWLDTQKEALGDAFHFEEEYRFFWAYIPHFIHAPFYVYAYAFGDCLVNSLYAVYQEAHEGFAQRYLDLLRAGGSLRHKELLAPFGLDASDSGFWQRGLDVIGAMIDELEAMD